MAFRLKQPNSLFDFHTVVDGVAEVARVARAVAEAEERDLLPAEVRVRQLAVEPVVDVRACV